MKLRLPYSLVHALLTTCAVALTTSTLVFADVPEGYTPVIITDVAQLVNYTASDYIAFIISSDVTNSAYMMRGAHQYWTDDVPHTHVLTFADIALTGAMGYQAELVAENFQELSFSQNESTSSYAGGGAIFAGGPLNLTDNETVTFSGNSAVGVNSYGGAIFANFGSTIDLTENGNVTFSGNSATYSGGAIYARDTLNLTDNETVTFSGNSAVDESAHASGGAIDNHNESCIITLNDNGSVTFSGNSAVGDVSYGGAIHAWGTLNLMGNETVTFSGNSVVGEAGEGCYGGAISAEGTLNLTNNKTVTFSDNFAVGDNSRGGAIHQDRGTLNLWGIGNVTFSGNSAVGVNSCGGAIHAWATLNLTGIGNVTFSGNSAVGDYSSGGAICVSSGTFNLMGNENVTFSKNSAQWGGAIRVSSGTFNLMGNENVTFNGNSAAYGGAISAGADVTVNLSGNGHVVFQGNYEISGNADSATYQLRGLCGDHTSILSMSAGAGQDVVFYDTLYAGSSSTVSFNAKYVDQDGVQQKATGDIVFSGKHAAEDLAALKPNYTQQELTNSLTTEVYTTTNLYGGRLRIEDGAVYKGNGIDAAEGSGATLRLAGGTLDQTGYAIALRSGTALEIAGTDNSVSAETLSLVAGSELVLEAGASATINGTLQLAAQDSVPGSVSGGVEIAADSVSGTDGKGTMERVSMGTLADFTIENMSISGSLIDVGEGTTLYLVNVDIQADSRITDDAAWLDMTATNAWLTKDNTVATGRRTLETDTTLYASGDTAATITLAAGSEIVELTSDMFDTVTLTGSDLWLDMTAIAGTVASAEYASLDFRSLTRALSNAMVDVDNLKVYATTDGITYKQAYAMTDHGNTTTLYFAGMVPEPSTGTLSLLALAALAARRRKR